MKASDIAKLKIQRRVTRAVNGIQFYIEELVTAKKLSSWKIAKVHYSYAAAIKAMEKMNVNQECN